MKHWLGDAGRLASFSIWSALASALLWCQATSAREYAVPYFTAAGTTQQGFARIINLSDRSGEVRVVAIDDGGTRFGPIVFTLAPMATRHFNSDDLEAGNADKGLSGGVGDGEGDWRLEITTDLEIEPLAYIRHADGFLTSMHDKVIQGRDLFIFNPGSNQNQQSVLRLVNRAPKLSEVTISGVDDRNVGGTVKLTIPAGAAAQLTARELESGASGGIGEGTGKWRLRIDDSTPVFAMSLLHSRMTNKLTNLSSPPSRGLRAIPLFLSSANASGQGFVRVHNRSGRDGVVEITAFDDSGERRGPARLTVGANETVHFNSDDLETGNPEKDLVDGVGVTTRGR